MKVDAFHGKREGCSAFFVKNHRRRVLRKFFVALLARSVYNEKNCL